MVCGLGLSPKYVLDEMQTYEMQPLIDRAYLRNRESWEQTRTICNYIHNAWFKGDFKMTFPWDGKDKVAEEPGSISDDHGKEIDMIFAAGEQLMRNINNGKRAD